MGAISPVQIALVLDWVDRHADVLASVAPLNAWPDVSGSLVPVAVGGAASSSDVGRRPSAAPVAARARPPTPEPLPLPGQRSPRRRAPPVAAA